MKTPAAPLAAMKRRCSIRNHTGAPLDETTLKTLRDLLAGVHTGPFGNPVRLALIASTGDNASDLKGLHTYGMIRGATAYLLGAVGPGRMNLEDAGYALEVADLNLTAMGLGSCWLGGTFTKSGFAAKMGLKADEEMPCAISLGPIDATGGVDRVEERLKGRKRLEWRELFFENDFRTPLAPERAGAYAEPLEMVRLAPSATNKQPWRVVRVGDRYHFHLQRSLLYGKAGRHLRLVGLSDLQRVDLGIAMCHFQLAADELGLKGGWELADPRLPLPGWGKEYVATWKPLP